MEDLQAALIATTRHLQDFLTMQEHRQAKGDGNFSTSIKSISKRIVENIKLLEKHKT